MEPKIKSEFHNLIPPISPDEYRLLEESILKEGCREAIITWDGYILDGHNRFEICQKHDLKYGTHEKSFENEDEAKQWIIRNQLARRNLAAHERARLALMLKPMIQEKAKEKQKEEGSRLGGSPTLSQKSVKGSVDTQHELARLAGVSHDTIHKVEVIEKEAPEEIKQASRRGEISVNKAYKATRPAKPKKEIKKEESVAHRGDSDILFKLKSNWNQANNTDKRRFLKWLKQRKEL